MLNTFWSWTICCFFLYSKNTYTQKWIISKSVRFNYSARRVDLQRCISMHFRPHIVFDRIMPDMLTIAKYIFTDNFNGTDQVEQKTVSSCMFWSKSIDCMSRAEDNRNVERWIIDWAAFKFRFIQLAWPTAKSVADNCVHKICLLFLKYTPLMITGRGDGEYNNSNSQISSWNVYNRMQIFRTHTKIWIPPYAAICALLSYRLVNMRVERRLDAPHKFSFLCEIGEICINMLKYENHVILFIQFCGAVHYSRACIVWVTNKWMNQHSTHVLYQFFMCQSKTAVSR